MKLITILSGAFTFSTLSLAGLFSILHWKGASFLSLFGFTSLALIFIPSLAIILYRNLKFKPTRS